VKHDKTQQPAIEKRGGYQAGPKTPSQVKPPPAAFAKPKTVGQKAS